jgi:hypothetical protein
VNGPDSTLRDITPANLPLLCPVSGVAMNVMQFDIRTMRVAAWMGRRYEAVMKTAAPGHRAERQANVGSGSQFRERPGNSPGFESVHDRRMDG